jgi:hypothetical protein
MPPRTAARSLLKGLKCYTPSFHSDPLLTNAAQCNRQCVARPRAGIILADNVTFAIEETSALAQQRPNHRPVWTWISKPTEDRQAGQRNLLRLPCLPAPQKAHRAVFCAIKGKLSRTSPCDALWAFCGAVGERRWALWSVRRCSQRQKGAPENGGLCFAPEGGNSPPLA